MDPVAFRLPVIGLPIYWYCIIVVVCILVGCAVAVVEAKRKGQDTDHIWNGLILVIILGLIGARLYHVISSPQGLVRGFEYYRQHPVEIFLIRQGGLGIPRPSPHRITDLAWRIHEPYVKPYYHLCRAQAFVPTGKVCHLQPVPEALTAEDVELAERLWREGPDWQLLPNIRLNYRDYGLDARSLAAFREVLGSRD